MRAGRRRRAGGQRPRARGAALGRARRAGGGARPGALAEPLDRRADRGRLTAGVELTGDAHIVRRDGRRAAWYGTRELVEVIRHGAAEVARAHPGPRLVVGDLSAERGGRLSPHRSHRSGRDADLGFYLLGEDGSSVEAPQFVRLARNGCGRLRDQRYCFDAARNWALLVALVTHPLARVQYILVSPDIRARVLAEGERRGAPAELLERVRVATAPHSGSHSHRSHFHLRIYCAPDDRPDCVDEPPTTRGTRASRRRAPPRCGAAASACSARSPGVARPDAPAAERG
ncbi:MAG: penicillin-insensitive murein endopeptidase [Sandaracinaceae bacterium]|nr:penicillin-insensitive murein endopeptidase [Sandaracinaceae bacterium]